MRSGDRPLDGCCGAAARNTDRAAATSIRTAFDHSSRRRRAETRARFDDNDLIEPETLGQMLMAMRWTANFLTVVGKPWLFVGIPRCRRGQCCRGAVEPSFQQLWSTRCRCSEERRSRQLTSFMPVQI
jgi:hypothetical protein